MTACTSRGFFCSLMAAEHRPVAIDNLRGTDALGLNIGQDFSYRIGRGTIGRDYHLQRLRVVHYGAERLTELVSNRARQRRHRFPAVGVGGERQVPPAFHLGPLPCAALVQEPDDQERLDERARRPRSAP